MEKLLGFSSNGTTLISQEGHFINFWKQTHTTQFFLSDRLILDLVFTRFSALKTVLQAIFYCSTAIPTCF